MNPTIFDHKYVSAIIKTLQATPQVNPRTGVKCRATYDVEFIYRPAKQLPVLTLRPINWKSAIAELLGYLKGYSSAAQFRELGTKTWDANANENKTWLSNPLRKGTDDMGRVYGVQGRKWLSPIYNTNGSFDHIARVDQLAKIVHNLQQGIDDRGELLSFWNPGEFTAGCLRPCMYEYMFTIQDGKLCLRAQQRSCDAGLGFCFNAIQASTMLLIMCKLTGLPIGTVRHCIDNFHIYENQVDAMCELVKRMAYEYIEPLPDNPIQLTISDDLQTLNYLTNTMTVDDFVLINYEPLAPLTNKIPFSV